MKTRQPCRLSLSSLAEIYPIISERGPHRGSRSMILTYNSSGLNSRTSPPSMFTDSVQWPFYSPKNILRKCLAGLQAWEFSLWPAEGLHPHGMKNLISAFFSCSSWLFFLMYKCPLNAATHICWWGFRGSLMLVSTMKGWQPSHIYYILYCVWISKC